MDLQLQHQYTGGAAEARSRRTARIAEVEANPRCRDSVAAGRGRWRGGSREQAAATARRVWGAGGRSRAGGTVEEEEFAEVWAARGRWIVRGVGIAGNNYEKD